VAIKVDASHEGFLGRRIDEMPSGWWRPISLPELLSLGPIKMGPGKIAIRITVIGRLYWERERLIYATESARWLMQCLDRLGIFDTEAPQGLDPPEVLKALAVLRRSLIHVKGLQTPEQAGARRLAESDGLWVQSVPSGGAVDNPD